MSVIVLCELLESRNLFAAGSIALDPKYVFGYAAIKAKVGEDFRVFEALPISGSRTLLLADRDEHFENGHVGRLGLLTLVVVKDDGTLDGTFGDAGVALTGRVIEYLDKPGRLAVDGAGRVYFADSTRVIRLTRRGATDRTFGKNGAIGFAPADKPALVCDIVPTVDDDVLVATTPSGDVKQSYTVQKVGHAASTVWSSKPIDLIDRDGNPTNIDPGDGQFAAIGDTIVFAHVETNTKRVLDPNNVENPLGFYTLTMRQQVVLTRFDGTGNGDAEVARQDLRRPPQYDPADKDRKGSTAIGTTDYRYPNYHNVRITDDARYVQVLTDQELLRFDLKNKAYKRSALPGNYRSDTVSTMPAYQLLPDGGLGVIIGNFDKRGRSIIELDRYLPDGSPDPRYTDSGVFVVKQTDFPAGGRENVVDQIFLDGYGRLNYLSTGTITEAPTNLTLRRLV